MNAGTLKHVATAALLLACSLAASAKLNVVATTSDFGSLAREIGGDKVEVFVIARPTEDAHFVDAKPSYVVKLNRADALIEGGAELEAGWLPPLLDKARNSKLSPGKPGRIVAHEGVTLLEVPTELDRSKGDVHGGGNPHFLTNPDNAKTVAAHIADSFSKLEPASASVFKANLERFTRELAAKIKQWDQQMAPHKGRRVVAYHNAWPYFASRFGLRIDLFLEPKPGIPPSASHLSALVGRMKAENVHVIIVEPFRDRRYAETTAKHANAIVTDVSPYPGAKSGNQTYIEWMDQLVTSLAKALGSRQ